MKNKLKALVAGTLGVCAMAMVGVAKVNAASIKDINVGTAIVSTTTNTGDTKTWDWTKNTISTQISAGNSCNGIIMEVAKATAKSNILSMTGTVFYVPVSSTSDSGSVYITNSANRNDRFITMNGTADNKKELSMTAVEYAFTSADLVTYTADNAAPAYVKFTVSGGEAKLNSIECILTSGSYGAAAVTYTITYKDGDSTLYVDDTVVEGANITYSPKKYGYDFEGWYTDAELTNKVDSSYTVTADDTLYSKWTAWTTTGIEEYTLSNAAIGKISTGIDGSLTADLALTPSIYTYMKGGAMTTTNVTLPNEKTEAKNACFNTGGAVSTTGNGIKFTAPFNGTFTTYIGCGGTGTARSAKLTDGTNDITPTQGADALAFDGTTYAPIELTFNVTKGTTYYLGGTSGMRIYYLNFEADPSATFLAQYDTATHADATKIRFIAVLDNITDVTTIDTVKFTLTYNETEKTFACTKLYSAVTSLNNDNCAAKTNRYFAVYTLAGDNIAAAISANAVLSNLKVTITFTDGTTSVVAAHADIELGK